MQKLGYTLSHVVHGYGSICQSVTELAIDKRVPIATAEFQQLNQCLDTAIAGAVTKFQWTRSEGDSSRETEHLGFFAHELRNSLSVATMSLRLIKSGTIGFGGSTGMVLDKAIRHSISTPISTCCTRPYQISCRTRPSTAAQAGASEFGAASRSGGLKASTPADLFKPYEQPNQNRNGEGLRLTIARRAVELNDGTIEVENLPGRGCMFKILLLVT